MYGTLPANSFLKSYFPKSLAVSDMRTLWNLIQFHIFCRDWCCTPSIVGHGSDSVPSMVRTSSAHHHIHKYTGNNNTDNIFQSLVAMHAWVHQTASTKVCLLSTHSLFPAEVLPLCTTTASGAPTAATATTMPSLRRIKGASVLDAAAPACSVDSLTAVLPGTSSLGNIAEDSEAGIVDAGTTGLIPAAVFPGKKLLGEGASDVEGEDSMVWFCNCCLIACCAVNVNSTPLEVSTQFMRFLKSALYCHEPSVEFKCSAVRIHKLQIADGDVERSQPLSFLPGW